MNGSQFYITTGENLHSLDEKHTIFGEVAEGLDILEAIDSAPCDDNGRPLQNIRIRHTIVLDDPLPDPRGLEDSIPDASPEPQVHARKLPSGQDLETALTSFELLPAVCRRWAPGGRLGAG